MEGSAFNRANIRDDIIKSVLGKCGLSAAEVFDSKYKFPAVMNARREIARELVKAGFTWVRTAQIVGVHERTIRHYIHPRAARKMRDHTRAVNAHQQISEQTKDIVQTIASESGVGVFSLCAKWIAERAEQEAAKRSPANG